MIKQFIRTGLSLLVATSIWAEEDSKPQLTMGIDFDSAYVSEGRTFNDNMVIQPWADLSGINLGNIPIGFAAWANYDVSGYMGGAVRENRVQEIDYDIYAQIPNRFLDITPSVRIWTYPDSGSQTDTLLAIDFGKALAESGFYVGLYYDMTVDGGAEGDSTLKPYVSYTRQLNENTTLKLYSNLYYQNFEDGKQGFGAYDLGTKVSWKHFYASITYFGQLDDNVLPEEEFNYDVDVVGSVGVSYSF